MSGSIGAICRAATYVGAALIGGAALANGSWASAAWAVPSAPQMQPAAPEAVAQVAEAAPALACRALSFQTCYFRITDAASGRQQVFGVKGGVQLPEPGLSLGDRYMLSVNRPPPASENLCGGQFDKRNSLWCKKGVVRAGIND